MARRALATVLMLSVALPAFGWWNDEWEFRKPITLNTTASGANLAAPVDEAVVLVRLHMGNFGYFSDTLPNGDDLRFVASDDVTPLPFNVETFDATNQIALAWVKVGAVQAQATTQSFFMYYGNSKAPAGSNAGQTYDKHQSLVLQFENAAGPPKDKTAYGNHPGDSSALFEPGSLIGGGARFGGNGVIRIPGSPSLNVQSAKGWTFSAWVRLDQPQQDGTLVEVADAANGRVALTIRDLNPILTIGGAPGQAPVELAASSGLRTDAWHHVAVVLEGELARIYIDGGIAAEGTVPAVTANGGYTIGARSDGTGQLTGVVIDEVGVASVARSQNWIGLSARSEGMGAALLALGEDAQREAGHQESYFVTTLRNVTVDGWVVIGILIFMAMISWYVMIAKGLVIRRIRADNAAFTKAFYDTEQITDLYHETTREEIEAQNGDLLEAIKGHSGYVSSTLYHLYQAGMRDVHERLVGTSASARRKALTPEAINTIKASLDAASVRESQRLNGQMVLLTLAISGGPFLGLLGTVVGVMITFAAIAASGDVNVNAIAPGIAAALVATVAGLGVAIPALFGYNYIGSRIREITADNRVFVDEYIASLAETYL